MPARLLSAAIALAAALALSLAPPALADEDPPGCPQEVTFDPAVPTFAEVVGVPLGAGGAGTVAHRPSTDIHRYFDRLVAHTTDHARVKVIRKDFGTSVLGRPLRFYVVSSRDNIENLDAGRADGRFWEGVKDGSVSEAAALAAVRDRPAIGWITATPHGDEPAAGEAISRMLYELVARTDCWNLRRLATMDLFLMPVRNPDGRDAPLRPFGTDPLYPLRAGVRTSAWAFDHNRDFGTQNQIENRTFLPLLKRYPGLFFIDAHQQATGYFFPPNEDPVHHEISNFSLEFIQNRIGPALQQKFNDQSSAYRNYDRYDLFVPEFGDSVPSLLSGAAGMTFEKGRSEVYGKQVYDHYLAIDETVNVTVRDKVNLLAAWSSQWEEAVQQGQSCLLQPNKLVSPISASIQRAVPLDARVCGYFYRPDNHAGDAAELIRHMRRQGVHVYRFDHPMALNGVREFGQDAASTQTLPAGTLYIPMAQPLKHWIQAVLGEDPFQPLNFFYDVAQWSYSLQRGQSGNGYLTEQPVGLSMTEIADPAFGTAPATPAAVYAFDTDSMQALAMVTELLDAGVRVSRGKDPFDAAGKHFETGAALVDGDSLRAAGVDLAALAAKRSTPVSALDRHPVASYALTKPKIGLFTGGATEPNNPLRPAPGSIYPGHCGVGGDTIYCQALFTLTQKIGVPSSMIEPITTTDLAAGRLVSGGFTALVNPSSNTAAQAIPAGPGATALQAFVNQGGRYVGQLVAGTTSARNAGLTALNTNAIAGLSTPGSFFAASYDTSNPVAWGFDNGGFIYRETTADPVFDPATLGAGAVAAVSYRSPIKSFGFPLRDRDVDPGGQPSPQRAAATQLAGRPAVVDQPFGAGHAILIGFDSFFRAWRESDERLILNAVLYPTGAVTPASLRVAERELIDPLPGQPSATVPAKPAPKGKLPAVRSRPVRAVDRTARDVRIRVARKHGPALRRAVRGAKLSKALRRKVRWHTTRKAVTFVVRGVRTDANDHDRGIWTGRIVTPLKRRGIPVQFAQL
jgi:hypothetical protein